VTSRLNYSKGGCLLVGCRLPLVHAASVFIGVLLVTALAFGSQAFADDASAAAANLSRRSFALLDSLNRETSGGNSSPLLGPVASFAADADALSHALKAGDSTAASHALGALTADQGSVDSALAAHPNAVNAAQWKVLKDELAKLATSVPHVSHGTGGASPPGSLSSTTATRSRGDLVGPAPASDNHPPRIVISSRYERDDTAHIKGYFEGNDLKSAGIWNNDEEAKGFKVSGVPGKQRVNFKLAIEHPGPGTFLRVTDSQDRMAEASVLGSDDDAGLPVSSDSAEASVPAIPYEAPPPSPESSGGTAVIPSHGPVRPSPSKRHTIGGRLGDVSINIFGITEIANAPASYEVTGEISGKGVTRAGVYVDGRLVQRIPITRGAASNRFDTRFTSNTGSATIRVYGVGGQFVENSLDLTEAHASVSAPMMAAPAGIAIQIISVSPVAPTLYTVTGVISGRHIMSAGLYQNGTLAQSIPIRGSLLGAIIPGASQRISFSARFNPYMGPAVIRAFDSSGAYADQPIIIAGANPSPMNPYAVNPYGTAPISPYYRSASPAGRPPYGGMRTRPLW
jgi:hypothetical protein